MNPNDYIIKTKDGEFVIVYAVKNFYSYPVEFCEHGFEGRCWKPSEVELVEYPTKYGRWRTYKYIHLSKNELSNLINHFNHL